MNQDMNTIIKAEIKKMSEAQERLVRLARKQYERHPTPALNRKIDLLVEGMNSPALSYLLIATAATESGWRTREALNGHEVGICQFTTQSLSFLISAYGYMFPTFWGNQPTLHSIIDKLKHKRGDIESYMFARLLYFTKPAPLPVVSKAYIIMKYTNERDDLIWCYYKKHYNSSMGSATFEHWQRETEVVRQYFSEHWRGSATG